MPKSGSFIFWRGITMGPGNIGSSKDVHDAYYVLILWYITNIKQIYIYMHIHIHMNDKEIDNIFLTFTCSLPLLFFDYFLIIISLTAIILANNTQFTLQYHDLIIKTINNGINIHHLFLSIICYSIHILHHILINVVSTSNNVLIGDG